jgi:predicted metal-dependent phosphoesterase TrpH
MVHYWREKEIEVKIDLHIHTRTGSDGSLSVEEVFGEAEKRGIGLISITDHDSIDHQKQVIEIAGMHNIMCVTGVELNVTFEYHSKSVSLDFLGYGYNTDNEELLRKLQLIRKYRKTRVRQIMDNLNMEFAKENIPQFTREDLSSMQEGVDGVLSRPHIADYLIKRGIVNSRQEAFDKYLVKCDVPKYPLSLAEASRLIRNAGGVLIHAHPNDPNGTSLVSITSDLDEQTHIIEEYMLEYIDGVECWHSRHDARTIAHYIEFAKKRGLVMSGGSDCHQKPILMGTLDIPGYIAEQFNVSR